MCILNLIMIMYSPVHLLKWTFRISRLHCEKCGTKNVKSILNENNVEDVQTRWKKYVHNNLEDEKKICSHRRKHWFEKQTRWLKLETDGCKNKSKSVDHFKFHFIAQIQNTKNSFPSLAFKVSYLFWNPHLQQSNKIF